MQSWKQEIVEAIGMPCMDEEFFNTVLDNLSDDDRAALTGLKMTIEKAQGLFFSAANAVAPHNPQPPKMEPWERCASFFLWGKTDLKRLVDDRSDELYSIFCTNSSPAPSAEVRKQYADELESLTRKLNPQAVGAIVHGHHVGEFIPTCITGEFRAPNIYTDLSNLSYYWDMMGQCTIFHLDAPGYECLHPYHREKFTVDGIEYARVIDAFTASKTRDMDMRHSMLSARHNVRPYVLHNVVPYDGWDAKAEVDKIVECRFADDAPSRRCLMSTGTRDIVYQNEFHDKVLGCCCEGVGENLYGKALIKYRAKLLAEGV